LFLFLIADPDADPVNGSRSGSGFKVSELKILSSTRNEERLPSKGTTSISKMEI
jgi:hypothetical protein